MAVPYGENQFTYGLHDPGGEHLLMDGNTAKGWVLVTEAIGAEAHERGGKDYRNITKQKLGLIVRLNQSYGENGTIPREARYPEFAQRVSKPISQPLDDSGFKSGLPTKKSSKKP